MLRRRSMLAGAIATVGAGIIAPARSWSKSIDNILHDGYMRIATTGLDTPYNFTDQNGNISGFDIDWSRLICRELGIEARFTRLPWHGILPGLMAGQFDGVMSAVRVTPERAASFTFSAPYTTDSATIVVRSSDDTIHDIQDLRGRVVGVPSGSIFEQIAADMAHAGTVQTYPGRPDVFMDLLSNRLDAAIVGRNGAIYTIHKNSLGLKLVGPELRPQPIAMVLPHGATDVAGKVSQIILAQKANGQAKVLFDRWFTG